MLSARAVQIDVRPGILVVEDERVVAMDLAGTLHELGYRVVGIAARADDAIRRARQFKPDLILMDIRLAGESMDGIEVATEIRRQHDVPVIYLTAHSDDDNLRRAAETSAAGYLVKPFKSPELRCAIEIALHKHAADRRVKERERWLSATLLSVADAVIATDHDGHIRLFNTVAEQLTGWSEQDARSQPAGQLLSIVDERTGEPLGDVIEQVLATKSPQQRTANTALVSRSGQQIPVEERATPIVDDEGRLLGAVWVLRDVTERRRQLQHIQKLNEDLERRVMQRTADLQEANRELEAFGYSVAHDLRAPLRAIAAFSQLLSTEHATQLDADGQRYLARMRYGVARMSELIDALLALAGVGRRELNVVEIDICDLARSVAADVIANHPGHTVSFSVDCNVVLSSDVALVRLILSNLLDNAWKFTKRHAAPQVNFGICEIKGMEAFYVRDNGAGFDPRYTGKLFEAFQRLHNESAFPGTGIGLAIVARAVRRLGGSIWAHSQPDKGATFYFTLARRPD